MGGDRRLSTFQHTEPIEKDGSGVTGHIFLGSEVVGYFEKKAYELGLFVFF